MNTFGFALYIIWGFDFWKDVSLVIWSLPLLSNISLLYLFIYIGFSIFYDLDYLSRFFFNWKSSYYFWLKFWILTCFPLLERGIWRLLSWGSLKLDGLLLLSCLGVLLLFYSELCPLFIPLFLPIYKFFFFSSSFILVRNPLIKRGAWDI